MYRGFCTLNCAMKFSEFCNVLFDVPIKAMGSRPCLKPGPVGDGALLKFDNFSCMRPGEFAPGVTPICGFLWKAPF